MKSEYYSREVTKAQIENALLLYKQWCKENKFKPETKNYEDIHEGNLDHILYHAVECKGMKF